MTGCFWAELGRIERQPPSGGVFVYDGRRPPPRGLGSWDDRGGKFVEPKTKAGIRSIPLSGWLVVR